MNSDLKSRLLHIDHGDGGSQWARNPNGVEAVKEIDAKDAEIKRLRAALNQIDAIDPEAEVYSCSADAVRGLVLQMGNTARAALKGGDDE